MFSNRLVPFLLLAAAAPAQATIVHSAFDNPIYADNVSMGGPNLLLAIKTQMPIAAVATRVEIFTGEASGQNTIAIWSHDGPNNAPLAPLGDGSWQMCARNDWQGAPLLVPVSLAAGQDIWVVWGPINGAQASTSGNGAGAQPYRGSFNGGATWNGPFQSRQWKFRIWTGPAGHYEIFGAGCAGSVGTPRLCWSGMPLAGGTFDLHLDVAPPNGSALLTFGLSDTVFGGTPLPASLGGFGAPGCSVFAAPESTVFVPTDPNGSVVYPVTFAANPAFAGVMFYNQAYCLDAAANALGITVSNAGVAIVGS